MPGTAKRMHQTTVRFSPELWSMLEIEAAAGGVSVAQYIREAVLARAAYAAGRRAAEEDGRGFEWAEPHALAAIQAHREVRELAEDSAALQAQARQAITRSAELREQAKSARSRDGQ